MMTPDKAIVVTHALLKKLQAADWSTEEAGSKTPSKICVGVFTPSTIDQRSTAFKEVHDVKMDGQLNQLDNQCSAIGKNLCINYKINSTYDATKTLASILAFLTNLADWKPGKVRHQREKPRIVAFLEHIICKLVSMADRDW